MSEYPARREPPKSRFFIIHYKLRDSHVFERFVCLSQIKNVITKFKICNFWRLLNDCERIVTILETLFIVKKHYIDFDLEIPIEVHRSIYFLSRMGTCQVTWSSKGPKNNGHRFDQEKALCFGLYQSKMIRKEPIRKFGTSF